MLLQLEQKFLQANLAQAQILLADASEDDDPIGQHQFGQLVHEIEGKLAVIPQAVAEAPAGVALFFGGRPVFGSLGIQASFSGRAIEQFQTLVSQRFAAQELGSLASKGRVPYKDNSQLLVTDVVRGSFGFVLQATTVEPLNLENAQSKDASLKWAIDKVTEGISQLAAQDEAIFDSALSEIDERQKTALGEFFKLLDTEGATLRIVAGERDFELNQSAVQRACQRVKGLQISEYGQTVTGRVVGWSDVSAKFEMELHNTREILQGTVNRSELERVAAENLEPYHRHISASIKVKEITAVRKQPKRVHTLLGLELIDAPANWQSPPIQKTMG